MAAQVCVASSERTIPVVMVTGTSFLPDPARAGSEGNTLRAHLSRSDHRARLLVGVECLGGVSADDRQLLTARALSGGTTGIVGKLGRRRAVPTRR
jgi:hypothetical protein